MKMLHKPRRSFVRWRRRRPSGNLHVRLEANGNNFVERIEARAPRDNGPPLGPQTPALRVRPRSSMYPPGSLARFRAKGDTQ